MKRLVLPFAMALAILAACSKESPTTTTSGSAAPKSDVKPPDAQQARAIVEKSGELAQHEFTNAAVSLPIAGSSMNQPTRNTAEQLEAAGWIAMENSGDLMLTDKSRSDKRFLLRENGLLDIVPLAKKEMGEVTAVRLNADGTVNADFSWRWLPNDVGAAFTTGPLHDRFAAQHRATANLMWNGTEWTIITVDAR